MKHLKKFNEEANLNVNVDPSRICYGPFNALHSL